MMDDSIPLDQFEQLRNSTTPPVVVDIRRASDFGADPAIIPGALRGDPEQEELTLMSRIRSYFGL